jgi:hypothetical protein
VGVQFDYGVLATVAVGNLEILGSAQSPRRHHL